MIRSSLFLAVSSLLLACGPVRSAADFDNDAQVQEGTRFENGTIDSDLILWTANTQSFEILDDDVRLDRRAATNIVEGRPFATLDELDAVPWVGTTALDRMHTYGVEHADLEEDTVPLDADSLMLWAANTLSFEVLDDEVGLDRRAAENIVEERPFTTVDELDAVSYVGGSALQKLLAYGEAHHPRTDHPLLDVLVLRAANGLLINQLHYDLGWPRRSASYLVNTRPHHHADGLAGIPGVGDTEMAALEAFAIEQWGSLATPSQVTNYRWCPDDDDEEPNESALGASPLRLDYAYRVDNHDPDWLELTVDAGDTVTLWVDATQEAVDAVLWNEDLEPLVVGNDPHEDTETLVWTNHSNTQQTLYLEVVMGHFYGCAGYSVTRSDITPSAEVCGNGSDDDGDGDTDCGDADCIDSAACIDACPVDAFEPNEGPDTAVLLGANERIEAFVPSYDVDWFSFEVQPGDEVGLGGMGFVSWYTVFDEAGTPVHYKDNLFDADFTNLSAQTQTYTVRVDNHFRRCDEYVIETTTSPAVDVCTSDAYTLSTGQSPRIENALVQEPLSTQLGEVDAVSLYLDEGEGLYVRAALPETYGLLDVRLIAPDGSPHAAGFTLWNGAVELAVDDAESGLWTVEVRSFDDTPCAPYLLTAEPRAGAVVIQDDQEPNNSTATAGILFDELSGAVLETDVDLYQVEVEGYTWVEIDVEGGSDLGAQLYDPAWSSTSVSGDLSTGSDTLRLYNDWSTTQTFYLKLWSQGDTRANYRVVR